MFLLISKREEVELRPLAEGETVTLGRSNEATIAVDDPKASRLHTSVRLHRGTVIAEDLHSRNGTKINGSRVIGQKRTLKPGDLVMFGETEVAIIQVIGEKDENVVTADPRFEIMARALLLVRRLAGENAPHPKLARDARHAIVNYGWNSDSKDFAQGIAEAVKKAEGGRIAAEHLPPTFRLGPPTLNERGPDLSAVVKGKHPEKKG